MGKGLLVVLVLLGLACSAQATICGGKCGGEGDKCEEGCSCKCQCADGCLCSGEGGKWGFPSDQQVKYCGGRNMKLDRESWGYYKENFNMPTLLGGNQASDLAAFENFRRNLDRIRFRAGRSEENHLSTRWTHLSQDDFIKTYGGAVWPAEVMEAEGRALLPSGQRSWVAKGSTSKKDAEGSVTKIDYKTGQSRAVGFPSNQGECGAAWAFAVVGAIEAMWALQKGQALYLSQQELVMCMKKPGGEEPIGCSGSTVESGLRWAIQNGGLALNSDYRYNLGLANQSPQACTADILAQKAVDTSQLKFVRLEPDEKLIEDWVVRNGPVIAHIDARACGFQSFANGVLTPVEVEESAPNGRPEHAVLIVGFDNTAPSPHWVIQNSWGSMWGVKGTAMIQKGVDACGITSLAYAVWFEDSSELGEL